MTTKSSPATYWFGEQPVEAAQKTRLVRDVFDRVAGRYDLMNDLMSGGVHRLWKAAFVRALAPRPNRALLDLAAGTGDIAAGWRKAGGGPALLCDINAAMLIQGRDRALDQGAATGLEFVVGNAESLPFPDRSFDVCSIAFGLRNVTQIEAALAEARRVLKPGGRFLCLEFSRVALAPLRGLYDLYSDLVIPTLGSVVARDRESYLYLVESIRRFPDQDRLIGMMGDAGFGFCRYRNLSGGIAAIHQARRI